MGARKMLEGRNHAPENLGDVLVLGKGVTGRAAYRYLEPLVGSRVESLTVWDEKPADEGAPELEDVVAAESGSSGEHFDLCIASPGISQFADIYIAAQNVSDEVISEVEFAWRESSSDAKWVAITGTNGKTTTTALCSHLLCAAGFRAMPVGNIGDACIDAVAKEDGGAGCVFVAETSSYQLASTELFAPDAAVVLNITPDHLRWHKSHENYANAKWNVLKNLHSREGAVAVLDATCDEVRARVRELRKMTASERGFAYVPIGSSDGLESDMRSKCGSDNAAFERDGRMLVAFGECEHDFGEVDDMQIKGPHNVSNALAACTCAIALGADDAALRDGLSSFSPLEHRMEPAGKAQGITFVNDSKATNVDATCKALDAYAAVQPVILLGGDDKGTDLSELVAKTEACASGAVLYGEGADRFAEAFEGSPLPHKKAAGLEEALDVAIGMTQAGGTVLLSPACASFDEFKSFEDRGEKFKEMVKARA